MDDLFNFGAPSNSVAVLPSEVRGGSAAPAQQYSSRRELREAEARGSSAVAAPVEPTVQVAAPAFVQQAAPAIIQEEAPAAPSRRRAADSRPQAQQAKQAQQRQQDRQPLQQGRKQRKLKASERRALQASAPPQQRKNPLNVLATMAVVGGMFAVAGLPAYALQTPENTAATKSDASAQSVVVSSDASLATPTRDGYHATTYEQLAQMEDDAQREANQAAYLASGARALGDDYPWPYELRDYQGGGLSPLNYYYRECVDFVAWRLNRDAGYYAAPYKWVWANLTPSGGNASQWRYNWEQHGWPVSTTPIVGSVAWFYGNHVAYVKSVNADSTVTIEEYNYSSNGTYGQRTIPASSVPAFLYPPPS